MIQKFRVWIADDVTITLKKFLNKLLGLPTDSDILNNKRIKKSNKISYYIKTKDIDEPSVLFEIQKYIFQKYKIESSIVERKYIKSVERKYIKKFEDI